MAQPVKFEVSVTVTVTEDGVITPKCRVLVDSKQIYGIDRVRVDVDRRDDMPSIEIDFLRSMIAISTYGENFDLLKGMIRTCRENVDLLKKVPGVKCNMSVPGKT
jgi:hypothetical protein